MSASTCSSAAGPGSCWPFSFVPTTAPPREHRPGPDAPLAPPQPRLACPFLGSAGCLLLLLRAQEIEQVRLDRPTDLAERQVADVRLRKRVLQLDADLVQRQQRIGDEHGH